MIGRDATGLARTLTVDRGERDGVVKEAAVLAPAGIVGQVFLIIEGTLGEGCGLKFVKRTEDLQTGDVIVTSGVDGIFPRGLPLGRITSVDKRGQGLFSSRKDGAGVEASRARKALVGLLACGRGLPLGAAGRQGQQDESESRVIMARRPRSRTAGSTIVYRSPSSSAFASFRSRVAKPSVNQA